MSEFPATHPNYEVFEVLGSGHDTVVYRGYDLLLGRDVAIKTLSEDTRINPDRAQQFISEAQFLAQFEHENILRVYSVETAQHWIITELMTGTLADRLALPLDASLVRSVLTQMLRALSFLHGKGKTHGAVRPGNVLINDNGLVKLSDFEDLYKNGELRVPQTSAKCLAPELLNSAFGDFGPAVDVYTLGFTALELLIGPEFDEQFPGTGRHAIDAETAWMRWHSSEQPFDDVAQTVADLPPDLTEVLNCMLRKAVADRGTPDGLLDKLRNEPLLRIAVDPEFDGPRRIEYVAELRELGPQLAGRPRTTTDTTPGQKRVGLSIPTRVQINRWLAKPTVLYSACCGIFALALLMMVVIGGSPSTERTTSNPQLMEIETGPAAQTVTLTVLPPDASVHLGDQALAMEEGESSMDVHEGSSLEICIVRDGYDSFESKVEWAEMKAADWKVHVELDRSIAVLPHGFLAMPNASIDDASRLPTRMRSDRFSEDRLLEFVLVKAGKYTIGSEPSKHRHWDEVQRLVEVKSPFYFSLTEVSLTQFAAFHEAEGEEVAGADWQKPISEWKKTSRAQKSGKFHLATLDAADPDKEFPVTNVSPTSAEAFCGWLGGRLPTSVEWECAIRGLDEFTWEDLRSSESLDGPHLRRSAKTRLRPQQVRSTSRDITPLGILNAMGNVHELCRDTHPHGGFIAKGGSYLSLPDETRIAHRIPTNGTEWHVGIRVVVHVDEPSSGHGHGNDKIVDYATR